MKMLSQISYAAIDIAKRAFDELTASGLSVEGERHLTKAAENSWTGIASSFERAAKSDMS